MKNVFVLTLLSSLLLSGCSFWGFGGEDTARNDGEDSTQNLEDEAEELPAALTIYDFDDSCNGVPVSGAQAYSETAGTHKLLHFDRDSDTDSFYQDTYSLPEEWQVAYDGDASVVELISCATAMPKEEMVESCDYDIEGDTYTAQTFAADFKIELYEALTGKLVSETTLSLDAPECPAYRFFTDVVEPEYPDYSQALTTYLKAFVQK